MRKYTYLSNDSSYSVSAEDGVEILSLDKNNSSNSDGKCEDYTEEISYASDTTDSLQNDQRKMQAFSFEAQVGPHTNDVLN